MAARLGALLSAVGLGVATPAAAAPDDVRNAIVVVVVKGDNARLGNAPAAAQGTGFFISRDGYVATSYHVYGDLIKDGVEPSSVTYHVALNPTSPPLPASPLFINPAADLMVLYVAGAGGLNVMTLKPADRGNARVSTAITPVYSAGYPDGIGFSTGAGVIKSFDGPLAPIPVWTTSLTFKGGESGSPILLADNRVIAIAKAVDPGSSSIGLIVPSRLIPREYWDTDTTTSAAPTVSAEAAGRVRVEVRTAPTQAAERSQSVSFINTPCAAPVTRSETIRPRAGWRIAPGSVRTEVVAATGQTSLSITSATPEGIVVSATLKNLGSCVTVMGNQIANGLPARLQGRVLFSEVPDNAAKEWLLFSDVSLAKAVNTPLPSLPAADLRYTYVAPDGTETPFKPKATDFTRSGPGVLLSVEKAAARAAPSM